MIFFPFCHKKKSSFFHHFPCIHAYGLENCAYWRISPKNLDKKGFKCYNNCGCVQEIRTDTQVNRPNFRYFQYLTSSPRNQIQHSRGQYVSIHYFGVRGYTFRYAFTVASQAATVIEHITEGIYSALLRGRICKIFSFRLDRLSYQRRLVPKRILRQVRSITYYSALGVLHQLCRAPNRRIP